MGLDMSLYNKKDEEVMYWRKANQIRGWLVSHNIIEDDDNCVERPVSNDNLKSLIEDCKAVLNDHSLAEKLLPCTSGFFFGSDEFDEWYYEQLQETVDKLEPLVSTGEDFTYEDWW